MHYDNTIDLIEQYNCVTLNDHYESLAQAWVDARNFVNDNRILWTDNHIEFMIDYLRRPDMKVCWVAYGTGCMLKALLQANPNSHFNCVGIHTYPGLNMEHYKDYKRITIIPFQQHPTPRPPYKTNYNYEGKVWYFALKGN